MSLTERASKTKQAGLYLSSFFLLATVVCILVVIFYNKISNKINIIGIVLIVGLSLILTMSTMWVSAEIIYKQKNFSDKQKNDTCEDYVNYIYDYQPTMEWAILTSNVISVGILLVSSCLSLIFYKPLENRYLYSIVGTVIIIWILMVLVCHKFNNCIMKRYSYPLQKNDASSNPQN